MNCCHKIRPQEWWNFKCCAFKRLHTQLDLQSLPLPTSVSHGEPLDHQGWVWHLTHSSVSRLSRAEAEVVGDGAVAWGKSATHSGSLARRLVSCELRWPGFLREGEVRGLFWLSRGRGAESLPHLGVSGVTAAAVGTLPLAQGAGDGVGDGGRGLCVGVGHTWFWNNPLRGVGAWHACSSSSSSSLLLLVSVKGALLHYGLQVTAGGALRVANAAGWDLGNLEGRIGLAVTTPLDGLQLATDAVHRVVTATGLWRAVIHAAVGRVLASELKARVKSTWWGNVEKRNKFQASQWNTHLTSAVLHTMI